MIGGASHGDSEVKNRELMYRLMIRYLKHHAIHHRPPPYTEVATATRAADGDL